jgi:hypothetical protein
MRPAFSNCSAESSRCLTSACTIFTASASSSGARLSISRFLSAAFVMRSAPTRSASCAFIAAVRSPVIVSTSAMRQGYTRPRGFRVSSPRARDARPATSFLHLVLAPSLAAPPERARDDARASRRTTRRGAAAAARGAPLELGVPDDRTGGSSSLAADLHACCRRACRAATGGRRVRVTSVLSQQPGRLVFSARLVEGTDGRLIDVVSVSMATDGGDLSLASDALGGSRGRPRRRPPGALGAASGTGARPRVPRRRPPARAVARGGRALPLGPGVAAPRVAPRPGRAAAAGAHSGGILWTSDRESAFWALTSRVPRATVFAVEGERLSVASAAADSVPWPASRTACASGPARTSWTASRTRSAAARSWRSTGTARRSARSRRTARS